MSNNEISGFISNDYIKLMLPEDLHERAIFNFILQANDISYGQQGSNSACPQGKGDTPTLPSPTANTRSTHKVSKEPYSSLSLSHKKTKTKQNTTIATEMLMLGEGRKRGKNLHVLQNRLRYL